MIRDSSMKNLEIGLQNISKLVYKTLDKEAEKSYIRVDKV